MPNIFGSDRVLLYDVNPWNTMGFGVPNFGNNVGTLSMPVSNLVDEIGQGQLFIMTHVDAMRKQPPSINTVVRICRMVNRVRSVLVGRQKLDNAQRLEPGHATPAQEIWNIHPVPYFGGDIVRNHWLKEYNRLVMIALTNMMQHSDNNLPLTITHKFAADVWAYFNEIKYLIGSELLGILPTELASDDFMFTEAHYNTYNPSAVTMNIEAIDTPGPIFYLPTEDDLYPLLKGIPANIIVPMLKQYPVTSTLDFAGTLPKEGSGTVGASGPDAKKAVPVIGPPQL